MNKKLVIGIIVIVLVIVAVFMLARSPSTLQSNTQSTQSTVTGQESTTPALDSDDAVFTEFDNSLDGLG